jgi:hypothetical protein
MVLESESRTNNPCQYVSWDRLMETDFEDRSSIKFVQNRVHCPQVPTDGAERVGNTYMRRLMTGIHSQKCVVRRFRRCTNVIECTYTNLDSALYCS